MRHATAPAPGHAALANRSSSYKLVVHVGGPASRAPLAFYLVALQALRIDYEDDPFLVVTPHAKHPAGLALQRLNASACDVVVDAPGLLAGALQGARRLVAAEPPLLRLELARMRRRRRLEAVWAWCDGEPCGEPPRLGSPNMVSAVEVQLKRRHQEPGPSRLGIRLGRAAAVNGSHQLLVRSSLSPAWVSMPAVLEQPAERAAVVRRWGEHVFHDACVAYEYGRYKPLIAQASPGGSSLLWPLHLPAHFIEKLGVPWNPSRLSDLGLADIQAGAAASRRRPVRNTTRPRAYQYPMTWHAEHPRGFVVPLSMDNLWHVLWHAVPLREFVLRIARRALNPTYHEAAHMGEAGGVGLGLALSLGLGRLGLLPTDMPDEVLDEVGGADAALDAGDESAAGIAKTAEGTVEGIIEGTDLLPFFSFIWPEEAGSRRPPTGRRLGRSKRDLQPRPVASWGSWQLALLSMLSPRGWRRSVVRTQALLEPGRFHCYRTLYIGHAGFFPHFNIESEWRAAVPRVARFRSALLAHAAQTRRHARPAAGLVGPARLGGESSPSSSPAAPSILFVLRRGYRCIANEDELSRDVRGDWRLAGHVAFVRMDELSLLEQLRLSSGAKAIGGVHGQGLVWTALLAPTTARGCALLELQPNAMARTNSHSKYDYYRWSKLASCGYLKLVFPDSAECAGKYFRNCGNLTADATEVRTALWRVLAHVRRESALADVSMT